MHVASTINSSCSLPELIAQGIDLGSTQAAIRGSTNDSPPAVEPDDVRWVSHLVIHHAVFNHDDYGRLMNKLMYRSINRAWFNHKYIADDSPNNS